MAHISIATLRIRTDADWLRLIAYREALREIAKDVEPWQTEGAAAFAAHILRTFEPDSDKPEASNG